jgi:hypothetical protein
MCVLRYDHQPFLLFVFFGEIILGLSFNVEREETATPFVTKDQTFSLATSFC